NRRREPEAAVARSAERGVAADVAEALVRAVQAEVGRHVAGIAHAHGLKGGVGIAEAELAELAAQVHIGAVDAGRHVGAALVVTAGIQADQHADGDAVVEGRRTGEVDAHLLAEADALPAPIAAASARKRKWQLVGTAELGTD